MSRACSVCVCVVSMVIASASVASSTKMKMAAAMAKPCWLWRIVDMNLLQQTDRLSLTLKRDPCREQVVALGCATGVGKARRHAGRNSGGGGVDGERHFVGGGR